MGPPAEPDPGERDSARASEPPQTVELDVPRFRPAVLVVPPGSGPHPVFVAAHGAGGRGEWQCEWYTPILGDRAFILCPRGRAMTNAPDADTGYYYEDHYKLDREVMAALDALRARYAPAADTTRVTYAGYSQGAIMGALFAQKRGDVFSRLVLIEGGYEEWNVPSARRFQQAGGERVLFACGNAYCASKAERSVQWLERAGVPARLEHAPGGGHTYAGAVGERVIAALPWLFEGDERWTD
jgi:predicted esterase